MRQSTSLIQMQSKKPNLDLQTSQTKIRAPRNYETPTSSSKARVDHRFPNKSALKLFEAKLELSANQTHFDTVKPNNTTKTTKTTKNDNEESHFVIKFNARGNLKEIQNVDSPQESVLTKSIKNIASHAESLQAYRQSPQRYQEVKAKVICHNDSPSTRKGSPQQSKYATQQTSAVKIYSARIQERESQISQKEAELAAILQEIETKRNLRLTNLNQAAVPLRAESSPQCKPTFKTYSVVHDCLLTEQSQTKFELDCPEEQSSSNVLMAETVQSAIKKQESSRKKINTVMNFQIEEDTKLEKTKIVMQNQQRINSELYKPILKSKQNSLGSTPVRSKSKAKNEGFASQVSTTTKAARPLSSTQSNCQIKSKTKDLNLEDPLLQRHMLHTISSQLRIKTPTTHQKSPARPSTTPKRNLQPSVSVMLGSPNFGLTKNEKQSSGEINSEFSKLQSELEKQRTNSISNNNFYDHLNNITYGDFKKHESPNSRLMKQKNETVKQKSLLKNKEGQQYVVGVDKGYVVNQKQKLDYNLAEKKPMEFVTRFEQQELTKTKIKKVGGFYLCTEKTSKRNVGDICEKARQAILEAKGSMGVVDGVRPTRF